MSRTADYTIQGFLYQFNKTLLEILNAPDDAVITIEGIEDIDVSTPSMHTAIQCKYHETKRSFTASDIYKPLLQMMHHFYQYPDKNINYILFAHFPGECNKSALPVNKETLEESLRSKSPKFTRYINDLKGNIDLDAFLTKFSAPIGSSFDTLIQEVYAALQSSGFLETDIETLIYPNAIHTIASLSIKHVVSAREITKKQLLDSLRDVRKIAISCWTLALKTRKQILEAKRKELKSNLDKNSRRRYFVVNPDFSGDNFASEIVIFVEEYCAKYHFKPTHVEPPLFCLKTTEQIFRDVQSRLYKKGIVSTDGYFGDNFFEDHFLRKFKYSNRGSEFSIRLLRWRNLETINRYKGDDIFILGSGHYNDWDSNDVNIEVLGSQSIKEIKYILGISYVYE
jgi:hypothetical protein